VREGGREGKKEGRRERAVYISGNISTFLKLTVLEILRQKDHKFQVNQDCVVRTFLKEISCK
jgi:hypothetical protein